MSVHRPYIDKYDCRGGFKVTLIVEEVSDEG
jgi:hypothetical protein